MASCVHFGAVSRLREMPCAKRAAARIRESEGNVAALSYWEPMVRIAPTQVSKEHLAKLGVLALNRYGMLLECMSCHSIWSPRFGDHFRLPRGYWLCPNRCNW